MFLIFFIFLNTKYKNIKRSYEPLKAIIQFLRLFFALIYWLLKKLFIVEKLIVIIRSSNDVCHNIVDVFRHNAIHNILHNKANNWYSEKARHSWFKHIL